MTTACILIATADPATLESLTLTLRSHDYMVQVAHSGLAVHNLVQRMPPDLALLDLRLPETSVLALASGFRRDATSPFFPIVVLAPTNDADAKVAALEAGADDVLVMPVVLGELLARMRSLLRVKQGQAALLAERNKTRLLYGIQQELTSTLEIDAVVSRTVRLMVEAVQATQGSMIVFDPHGKVWRRTLARRGLSATEETVVTRQVLETGLGGLAVQTRTPQLVMDTEHDERWLHFANDASQVRSAIAVPLLTSDATLGVLTLTHPEPGHFTPAELDLLSTATGQISTALRNATLYSLLREAEAGRERFLNMLTHDLRGPLAGISGCLQVLEHAVPPDERMFVEMAQIACLTQERLIDDMLDVYKADGQLMAVELSAFSLSELAAEVLTTLRGTAADRNLELTVALPAHPYVRADRPKMLRVLLNLGSNALKFTQSGFVRITAQQTTKWMLLEVRDSGIGIPAEQLDQVFDRFFQGEQHGARRGTGLGLAFCREAIRAHGGRVWAESQVGCGTTMFATIPLAEES